MFRSIFDKFRNLSTISTIFKRAADRREERIKEATKHLAGETSRTDKSRYPYQQLKNRYNKLYRKAIRKHMHPSIIAARLERLNNVKKVIREVL